MGMYSLQSVTATFIMWQSLQMVCAFAIRWIFETSYGVRTVKDQKRRAKLIERGPTHIVSIIHAVIVTIRGFQHMSVILHASSIFKTHTPPLSIYVPSPQETVVVNELTRVEISNLLLTSYLLSDFYHLLMNYPKFGGLDMLFHHIAFLYCSIIGGIYSINSFMFCWLILGEFSTPFLISRWFLLTTGYDRTLLLRIIEILFAVIFFIARFAMYALGIIYQFSLFSSYPPYIPQWAVYSTFLVIVAGFFVNLYWLSTIFKLAKNTNNPKTEAETMSKRR